MIAQQGILPIISGMIVGLVGAVALAWLMKSLLFEVSATHPMTFIASALLLILMALLAC